MRVFGWLADWQGCGWYRCGLPLWGLKTHGGHDVAINTRMPDNIGTYDVVIGQRVSNPGPSKRWRDLAAAGARLVYEIDDDLFTVDPTNAVAHRLFGRADIQHNIRRNAALATLVTVSTQPLAEVMAEHAPNVLVLPNCVDDNLLNHQRPRRDRVTIGWAGSPTHAMDFAEVGSQLRRFAERNQQCDFHFIGENYGPATRLPETRVRHTAWCEDIVAYYHTIDYDIGLAPLRPHVFNRSKSHIKALEYAALGIPVVASDVGPYSEFVRHGITGFLVRRPHEWPLYLRDLVNDEAMREEMGRNARGHARTYSIGVAWHRWEQAYRALLPEAAVSA